MPFTTGLITNTRDFGTAATNIVVNVKNEDTLNAASIVIAIFNSPIATTLTPLYVTSYNMPANSIDIRTFNIAGNVAYEVQISVAGVVPSNVVLSVFGLDAFGNLVINQRVLQSEFTFISSLSPLS